MKKVAFLISVLLLYGLTANAHKFYMSICDMEFNQKTKSLEIVIKFFVDDFERALELETGDPMFLGTPKENWKADEFIETYINKHFQINVGSKAYNYKIIGKEVDKDYAWVYIELKDFKVNKPATMTNTLLTDYFEEQTNKINYSFNGENISFTLHKNKTTAQF